MASERLRDQLLSARSGDKVRIKDGVLRGARGSVFLIGTKQLGVVLEDGTSISLHPSEITNFSLAARRAWAAMPKRAGRPAAAVPRTKMISMRLNADLLRHVDRAVADGQFPSRTAAIEEGLRKVVSGGRVQPNLTRSTAI